MEQTIARLDMRTLRERFTKFYRARKVTIEMARSRGYPIGDQARILDMTLDQFISEYVKAVKKSEVVYSHFDQEYRRERKCVKKKESKEEEGGGETVEEETTCTDLLVFRFASKPGDSKKFGIKYTTKFIDEMRQTIGDNRTGVLIIEQQLSSNAKLAMEKKYPFDIQVFQLKDLQYNPTKNCFSPIEYHVMTETERKDFLTQNKILPKQMPLISVHDPIAKYFGLTVGAIIKKTVIQIIGDAANQATVEYSVCENVPIG